MRRRRSQSESAAPAKELPNGSMKLTVGLGRARSGDRALGPSAAA